MTDEGPLDETPPDSGSARPVPLPIDGGPGTPRKSRPWGVWLAVAFTVVVVVACGGAYLLARWVGDSLDSLSGAPDEFPGGSAAALLTPASVWWSGNGAYAVVQSVGADDRPEVTILKLATHDRRTLRGYRVVAVEQAAPRIWLVPDKRKTGLAGSSEPTTEALLDIAYDGVDARPAELQSLRLDSDADPSSAVDARWAAWDGPAGYTVSVEIDVNKGACASALRFGKVRSSLNAWAAKVPTDVATFEPIGWSPSGRYFAVITQADAKTAEAAVAEYLEGGEDDWGTYLEPPAYDASLIIFSAADGSVAARRDAKVPVHDANSGAATAAWMGSDDVLVHTDLETGPPQIKTLRPDGSETIAMDSGDEEWDVFEDDGVWMAGTDATSAVVVARNTGDFARIADVFLVGEDGPTPNVGTFVIPVASRWSMTGGMLSLVESDGDNSWAAFTSDIHGGSRIKLFELDGPDSEDFDD